MSNCISTKEPPYAERHVRWCERSENESRKKTTSFSSYSIQDRGESSGFGYASGLYHDGSEISFDVFSPSGGVSTLIVRCRCRFAYDADACMLTSGGNTYALQIPEAGPWCEVSMDILLEKGLNHITMKAVHPLKDDIHIDYIEILR